MGGFTIRRWDGCCRRILSYKHRVTRRVTAVQAVGAVASAFCGPWAAACYAGGTAINSHAHGATVKDSLTNGAVGGVSYWAFTPATGVGTPTPADFAIQAGIGVVAAENPQIGQALSLLYGSWGEPGDFAQNLVGNSLNYGASYAVGELAENYGMTLQQFNLLLALNSKLGLWAAGSTFNRDDGTVGGWASRQGGEIFGENSAIGWALFDLSDTILNAQGLIDAVSLDAIANWNGSPLTGHSLGAARVNNLYTSGYVSGATLQSLPAFAYPAAGARGSCGNLDPVCGGAVFSAVRVGMESRQSPSWWNIVENHRRESYQ